MIALSLELSLACRGCGGWMAVNACAPRVACDSCGRVTEISDARWVEILADALLEGPRLGEGSERTAPIEVPEGVLRRVVRRTAPPCSGCGTARSPEQLAQGSAQRFVACGNCGTSTRVRRPAWAVGALLAIAGEDPEQLGERARAASEPIKLACPACGGSLVPDGTERVVACRYCHAMTSLPDDVWARLHPRRPLRPIILLLNVAPTAAREQAHLRSVESAVVDRRGRVYLAGAARAQSRETADLEDMGDGGLWEQAVVCCDANTVVQWIRYPGLGEVSIALQHGERELFVWSGAGRLSIAVDGGPGEGRPELPVTPRAYFADVDGTWVAVTDNDVDRFQPSGAELPLFPDMPKGFWTSLFRAEDVAVGYLATATLAPTGDIFTIHRAEQQKTELTLSRWSRDGQKASWAFAGGDEHGLHLSSLAVAADGTIWHLPYRGGKILRITLSDTAPVVAAFPIEPADPDGRMVVLPNGEVLIVCEDGIAVRLSADGRIVWQSDAALQQATREEVVSAGRARGAY